ncbi:MAG: GGDEF domain-containing protein [Terriglobia bacterium]
MSNLEQVGPNARIPAELVRLESRRWEFWVLTIFAGVVLVLGALSFFFPRRFWEGGGLQISLSPPVLFVIMVGTVLAALLYVRRDFEVRGLRLANVHQYISSQEEQAKSMIDAVTKVFTRAYLHDLLTGEISRVERTNGSLALIMCDLNDFKQVNDRHGHLVGDYVLAQIAAILKSCVRGCDYVIRYGGDEFLVVLPDTDQDGGKIVRQRVHLKVAEWDRNNRMADAPITVSLGLHIHVNGQTAEMDLAEADFQMYADKKAAKQQTIAPPRTADTLNRRQSGFKVKHLSPSRTA